MATQRHEIEAWLGDDHGLDDAGILQLMEISDEINTRYPDPDDQPERDAALAAAYRLTAGEAPERILTELGAERLAAKRAELAALAALQQAALMLIPDRTISENAFCTQADLNRMSVRAWLGKR
ncbi:MAG: hypothetical protein HOV68_09985 [Streptomycetaceae bacterium]|nr:hypothetical protein [Streptomycetaceae bacterium]